MMHKCTVVNFLWGCILLLLSACGTGDKVDAPDVSHIEVDLKIRRLEKEIFALSSKQEVQQYLNANPVLDKRYIRRFTPIDPAKEAELIWQFINYAPNDTLMQEVDRIYGDLSALEQELEEAFRYVKYYYPDFKIPEIYTMVSGFMHFGFGGDMVDCDDFIVIGLDYFAGPEAAYRPPEIPTYILKRYAPEYLVPNLMLQLSGRFNRIDMKGRTMVTTMVNYGKSYEFLDRTMPYTADSLKWGWTPEEVEMVYYNEKKIWQHFVDNDLLYITKQFDINKYCGERPSVPELDQRCPGRVGNWLGQRIVRHYLDRHPEVTMKELMENNNSQQIFQQSRYRPASR